MARKPPPLISPEVVELMYQQQETQDGETNALIDLVIAATLLEATYSWSQLSSGVLKITIDPKNFVPMTEKFQIERILNDDGTRGVRMTRRENINVSDSVK